MDIFWTELFGLPRILKPSYQRAGAAQAVSEVTVWSEVIPPFTLMPREALQAAGNTVLAGVMRTLLPMFLRRRAPGQFLIACAWHCMVWCEVAKGLLLVYLCGRAAQDLRGLLGR